jgi:hypothetical protein
VKTGARRMGQGESGVGRDRAVQRNIHAGPRREQQVDAVAVMCGSGIRPGRDRQAAAIGVGQERSPSTGPNCPKAMSAGCKVNQFNILRRQHAPAGCGGRPAASSCYDV